MKCPIGSAYLTIHGMVDCCGKCKYVYIHPMDREFSELLICQVVDNEPVLSRPYF